MTPQQVARAKNVNSALSSARTGSTFALQMLRDQAQRLELAERMKVLREDSPYTQEAIADAIGLKTRSYQKAEQTGGISYEKLKLLAELHGVDFYWLQKGEERGATPDLAASQLDRIERKVDLLLSERGEPAERAAQAAVDAAQETQRRRTASAGKRRSKRKTPEAS